MSINSELERLDAVRDALVVSVNRKGGELPEDATLWQVKDGIDNITIGTDAPVVTQPVPSVSVNSSTGLVTAEYTPVAGLVEDTGKKSGTLQLTVQAAQTITPGTNDKTIAAGLYLTGTQTIKGDANLVAGNIKSGVSIFGVTGSLEAAGEEVTQPAPTVTINKSTGKVTATYTPKAGKVTDTSAKSGTLQLTVQAAQTITPGTSDKTIASGRYLTGTQTIKGDTNLAAGNIKKGISIFGVTGSYSGGTVTIPDTTATEKTLLHGYTAVVKDSSSSTGYKTIRGSMHMATSAELKSTPRIDTYNDNYAAAVEISGEGAECNVHGRVVRENHVQLDPVGGDNIIMQYGVPGAIEPPLPHIDTLEGAGAVDVQLIPVPLKNEDADQPEVSIRGPFYVQNGIKVILHMDPAFQAENIKKGVPMWGVVGTYEGDGGSSAATTPTVPDTCVAYLGSNGKLYVKKESGIAVVGLTKETSTDREGWDAYSGFTAGSISGSVLSQDGVYLQWEGFKDLNQKWSVHSLLNSGYREDSEVWRVGWGFDRVDDQYGSYDAELGYGTDATGFRCMAYVQKPRGDGPYLSSKWEFPDGRANREVSPVHCVSYGLSWDGNGHTADSKLYYYGDHYLPTNNSGHQKLFELPWYEEGMGYMGNAYSYSLGDRLYLGKPEKCDVGEAQSGVMILGFALELKSYGSGDYYSPLLTSAYKNL